MSISTFEANLRSGEVERCIRAARDAPDLGWPAALIASEVLRDSEQPKRSRAWALQVLSLFQATDVEWPRRPSPRYGTATPVFGPMRLSFSERFDRRTP